MDLLDQPPLHALGWTDAWAAALALMPPIDVPVADDDTPLVQISVGRVIAVHRGRWTVASPDGLIGADLLGIFRLGESLEVPGVGDWVRVRLRVEEDSKAQAALAVASAAGRQLALLGGTIEDVLPRASMLVRKTIGNRSEGQIIAANIDVALIVVPLDSDVSARRIERQLTTVWESGAKPVIVGTKADLAMSETVEALLEAAGDVPIIQTSTKTGVGFEELRSLLSPGLSLVLLGTSGAGKSSIVNRLLGSEVMATQNMGAAGKGRHTTTHRELIALPGGALLIDTPGMRELGLWLSGNEDGVAATFSEVDEVAEHCRFSDCTHQGDAGCAIATAMAAGELDPIRVEAWRRLHNEQQHNARRANERAKDKASRRQRK
jgi:ribosome biogenesis GTPase / thiamine phosphate phosphatase